MTSPIHFARLRVRHALTRARDRAVHHGIKGRITGPTYRALAVESGLAHAKMMYRLIQSVAREKRRAA